MGKTKIIHKTYTAYEYKDEIAFMNQESHNGWQLVSAGRFISKYEFKEDHTVEYRYQLDFNSLVVKYPDFYYLDTKVSSDIRTAISIEDRR